MGRIARDDHIGFDMPWHICEMSGEIAGSEVGKEMRAGDFRLGLSSARLLEWPGKRVLKGSVQVG